MRANPMCLQQYLRRRRDSASESPRRQGGEQVVRSMEHQLDTLLARSEKAVQALLWGSRSERDRAAADLAAAVRLAKGESNG